MQELLDQDLEDCIEQSFDKIDIRDERKVSIKIIKQALKSTVSLHNKT